MKPGNPGQPFSVTSILLADLGTVKKRPTSHPFGTRGDLTYVQVLLGATYSRMEHVDGLNGCLPLLLVPEHQVDPLADVLGHVLRLQGLSVDEDEETRVVPSPRREVDVVDSLAVLPHPKVET